MKRVSAGASLLACVPTVVVANSSFAVPVELPDFSARAITIGFDTLSDPDSTPIVGIPVPPYSGPIDPGAVIDDEYESLGVLFSSTDGGAVAVNDATGQVAGISPLNSLVGTRSDAMLGTMFWTGGPIFASFVDPMTGRPATTTQVGAFAIDVDIEPVSLSAFDIDGNLLETVFFSVGPSGSVDFAGIRRDEGIGSISINVPQADFLAIDDFIFEPVPEPASLGMLATGLVGLGLARRRRCHRP